MLTCGKKETLVFILELSTSYYIECLKKQKYNLSFCCLVAIVSTSRQLEHDMMMPLDKLLVQMHIMRY